MNGFYTLIFSRLRCVVPMLLIPALAYAQERTLEVTALPKGTEKRVALVIGNHDYQHMNPLRNPLNDAADMTQALRKLQFEVTTLTNTTQHELLRGLELFRQKLTPDHVAVVYFSGHGMSYDNTNYLIPIDANIACQEDVSIWGIKLDLVLSYTRPCRNSIVFLDACRKIPNLLKCPTPDRATDVKVGFVPPNNPLGSAVVFSTEQGTAADDNQTGRNGLFTEALLRYLTLPNLTLKNVVDRAAADVEKKSNYKQSPALYDKIRGDFVFIQTLIPSRPDSEKKTDKIPPAKPATRTYLDLPFAEMAYVPGGTFQMGDTRNEGDDGEKPVHTVTVSPFYMGKYEVTQRQWESVMGNNPSRNKECSDCPAEMISYDDVQVFLQKLNVITGNSYRLPTEAEWEYAAGGGSNNRTRFGNKSDSLKPSEANFNARRDYKKDYSESGQTVGKTIKVGRFPPNTFDLYDMSGNVHEMCADYYGEYSKKDQINPQGSKRGRILVARGGGLNAAPDMCRVSYRNTPIPSRSLPLSYVGFRIVAPVQ